MVNYRSKIKRTFTALIGFKIILHALFQQNDFSFLLIQVQRTETDAEFVQNVLHFRATNH